MLPVVIDRHAAAAEIHPFAYIAVADVGEMGDLRPLVKHGILDLHKVADMYPRADLAVGPDL